MKVAPIPENEKERLAYLRKIKILDTPLEERFERITRMVCRALSVPIAAVSLVDQDRQWFKSIQGLDACETGRDVAFCAHVILGDEPLIVDNALEDDRFHDNPLVTEGPEIRFYAGYPITVGAGYRVGTLCAIDTEPRSLSAEDLETLEDLAMMVQSELSAIALTEIKDELEDELQQAERAAMVDPLTRLWNRAGGEKIMLREWNSSKRNSTPIAIAMLDIDYFKKVNDTYGHDAGDAVIREIGKTILKMLRPNDMLCRWGGEEFLLAFPQCDYNSACQVLDRLLSNIRSMEIKTDAGNLQITASVGACIVQPNHTEQYAPYIKIADQALYNAKANGRDQYQLQETQHGKGVNAA